MGFSGRLEGITPSDIFQIISQSRMTGTLIARCQEGTAMVIFKNGQVIEAASDTPHESLGYLLVAQGLMSEDSIRAARDRRKQEPDRLLGEILVEMGAISEQTLESVVLRQIGHIVHRLVACEDGFFTFDNGEMALKRKLNTREFFLPSGVSAEYLMMERARTLDEERRSGTDRRAQTAGPVLGDELVGDIFAAADERRRFREAASMRGPGPWIRRTLLPAAAVMRTAAENVVRAGKRLAAVAADLPRRYALPWLRTLWSRVRALSPDGGAMIFAGTGGIVVGMVLILLTTLTFRTGGSELVVTGRVVNIRAKPSISAKVVTMAKHGETVSPITFKDGWHNVRTKAGETGWVWKSLVDRQEKKGLDVSYHMKGFELLLIGGLALLVMGIMRRRRAASAAPPAPGTPGE
jgi:hypothetical protein